MIRSHPSLPSRPIDLLLRQLGLDHLPGAEQPGTNCTLKVGAIHIELIESDQHGLTLQCFPGVLAEPTIAALSILLAENHARGDLPLISVSLVAEAPSNVQVWSRLSTKHSSTEVLVNWFVCFNELVQALHCWLDEGAPAFSAMSDGDTPAALLH
ncbi:hypothetical protein GCM10022212_26760 [Actimicrobium antarcticum]|uniref:Uncharacterized protein n=2 Tax=Actimicrobium antarcticum TaxID=1051899 RepID=A0ABP7TK17_9BURK